jgi:hypothetical protein
VGVRGAWAERRHRAPPSRRRGLGSVPSVVPPEGADADDVRACYPATATSPGPRQDPARHHVPGAPRRDHRHNGKLQYRKYITFTWIFILTCVSNFVSSTTCLLRSCSSHRPWGSNALPGGSAASEHVRQKHRCCLEVLCRRELRWDHRDSSPFARRSVILQLRLDSGFATYASHPCRRLLSSDGTTTAIGAGPAHLHAAAVCPPRHRYFQWTLFSTNAHSYCVFVVIIYFNHTGWPPLFPTARPRRRRRQHPQRRRSFR